MILLYGDFGKLDLFGMVFEAFIFNDTYFHKILHSKHVKFSVCARVYVYVRCACVILSVEIANILHIIDIYHF